MNGGSKLTMMTWLLCPLLLSTCSDVPVPLLRNAKTFHVIGDVTDEEGRPVERDMTIWEGNFISITEESSFGYRVEQMPKGHFDVRVGPCDMIALGFGGPGLEQEQLCFYSMSDVPNPLHVLLHKYIPPVKVEINPVGIFDAVADTRGNAHPGWSTMALHINADNTVTTLMKLADGKTVVDGAGTWAYVMCSRKDVISVTIQQPDGARDPLKLSGKAVELDISPDNNNLRQHGGDLYFTRIH